MRVRINEDTTAIWHGAHGVHFVHNDHPIDDFDYISFGWEKNKVTQLDALQALLQHLHDCAVVDGWLADIEDYETGLM